MLSHLTTKQKEVYFQLIVPSLRSIIRICRDLLALTNLFVTCTENLLSHWRVTPRISTSLQLGIIPIGD